MRFEERGTIFFKTLHRAMGSPLCRVKLSGYSDMVKVDPIYRAETNSNGPRPNNENLTLHNLYIA